METVDVPQRTGDPVTDVSLDTVAKKKQLLVFVNTKRSAEACADRIADGVKDNLPVGRRTQLSHDVVNVLADPTDQCERLADSIKYQVAFHHSGLHSEQRTIVEQAFKNGDIKAICATPTLAAGLDMPAYRVVIRDLQRFSGGWGMQPIPVLEYEQMSGRAGRPGYDDEGQAITIGEDDDEREEIRAEYIEAPPEPIQSKLAARPVLRTHTLSLVATQYVTTTDELDGFVEDTFYAKQYGDDDALNRKLQTVKSRLDEWDMIEYDQPSKDGFVTADQLTDDAQLEATDLGERVSELYLDPYAANTIVERLSRATDDPTAFATLHMVASTLEMRPLLSVRKGDREWLEQVLLRHEEDLLLASVPEPFKDDYDEFLKGLKTAHVLHEWIQEVSEKTISDKYDVSPGLLQAKRRLADWLLYSCDELCGILGRRDLAETIRRVRRRVDLGVKGELLGLTRFDGVGRVRSRRLHRAGITSRGDVKSASYERLNDVLGPKTAARLKEQVGEDVDPSNVDEESHGNLLDYAD